MIESRRVEVKKPKSKVPQCIHSSSITQNRLLIIRVMLQETETSRLFVGQLQDDVSKQDLKDYFEQFGEVVSVHYDQGKKRYAFVEYDDPEIASAVLREKVHIIKVRTGAFFLLCCSFET